MFNKIRPMRQGGKTMELFICYNDLRLRGSGFTLLPAAKEENVSEYVISDLFGILIKHLYETEMLSPTKDINEDYDGYMEELEYAEQDLIERNPQYATEFTALDAEDRNLDTILKAELVVENGSGKYTLTEKAKKIFFAAAEKQKRLDNEGFYCRPCAR
jgi:hypothetical protein